MSLSTRNIFITGANGFIGMNLIAHLKEKANTRITTFIRGDDESRLIDLVSKADIVVHLAGENRPSDEEDYFRINAGLTSKLCNAIRNKHKSTNILTPIILSSSTQAEQNNAYGNSKLKAEEELKKLSRDIGNPGTIFRLPGVFGKWCKPNYNSVVATFCYNIANNLPIKIHNPETEIRLVYIDEVIKSIISSVDQPLAKFSYMSATPEYVVKLGDLANKIRDLALNRKSLIGDRVGTGFLRSLYATYVSYLPKNQFSYSIPEYGDLRGNFVEFIKTKDCGQISYFTAHPCVTRGSHFHHTKTEKFLVIKGSALFRFRNLLTDEYVEIKTNGHKPQIVETIPGWAHEVTNIGTEEMFCILWANDNFDKQNPDTIQTTV